MKESMISAINALKELAEKKSVYVANEFREDFLALCYDTSIKLQSGSMAIDLERQFIGQYFYID